MARSHETRRHGSAVSKKGKANQEVHTHLVDPETPGPGRPRIIEFGEKEIRQIAALAQYMNLGEIANFFGISRDTQRRRFAEDPRLFAAYEEGRAAGTHRAGRALMKLIDAGNMQAIMFYLRAKANWRDKDPPPHIYRDVGEDSPEEKALGIRNLLQAMVEADEGVGLEEAEILSITTESSNGKRNGKPK